MMIFPSSTVLLLVNRSSSIPPLKVLAGVVIETKNRADENEARFRRFVMIAAIRVVIIREVFCGLWCFFKGNATLKSTRDDDVEQSLERGRLDVVDVVTLFKG